MSRSRFFLTKELPVGAAARLPLSDEDLHHASRVLRVAVGEEIDVVAPSGTGWRVRVVAVSAEAITVETMDELSLSAHPYVALFQGVAKGDKMDVIVRQAVEVGASQIVPVFTSRSVVRLTPEKRHQRGERWRRVASASAKQARRATVPSVADPVEFADALDLCGEFDTVVVLWEDQKDQLLSTVLRSTRLGPAKRVALVIGPEGGLSESEVAELQASGALVASLGPSILRTETASVAALSLVVAAIQEMHAAKTGQ